MSAYEVVKRKLETGMVEGEMHGCLRDCGRLAGGYAAAGDIDAGQMWDLAMLARQLSKNPEEGAKKWREAVKYGEREPVAYDQYIPEATGPAYEWNSVIGGNLQVIDSHYISERTIPEPAVWDPVAELTRYLETVFEASDLVAYVTESYYVESAQKYLPKKGCCDRTAGQLIEQLGKCNGDIGAVMGDVNPAVGAWIRFNPVDGQGVGNSNVTAHRYCLIESDKLAVELQYSLMLELELPIVAMVHSGGKSIHAIVRVDADNFAEYKSRVDFLWAVCQKNGLALDTQNRNPSRLSRMPGVMRDGRRQYLIHTNVGKRTWAEWREWIEDVNDDLPDIAALDVGDDEPELAPAIIDGLLREGHKMLLAGPSKAGKSFALMQLAIAVAEGGEWLGWGVKRGRVLYVNLELDPRSAKHRFWKIYKTMARKMSAGSIDVWDLRGNSASLDKLTPKLIRRAQKKGYTMIIIDPIYKVLTGDENSAEEMARFCNQFDRICKELSCAVVYCHHHSKGGQGHKASRDRSSGSGVFARDPDTIIDMMELGISDECRKQIVNRWSCDALAHALDQTAEGWRSKVSQDDALILRSLQAWCDRNGHADLYRAVLPDVTTAAMCATGWRVEVTVREFAGFAPRNYFYRYPVHIFDDADLLKGALPNGEEPPWQKKKEQREVDTENRSETRLHAVNFAWRTIMAERDPGDVPTLDELTARINDGIEGKGRSVAAIRRWVRDDCGEMFEVVGSKVILKTEAKEVV